jgi:uncharacterized protein (DUF1697 family)
MPKYIAFLRAINVGGHTVKMERLKKLFEALGFSKVETFIASGNVIFDSGSKNTKALEKKIEAHLKKLLGYEVATFIRSTSELADIARYKPFADSELNADGNSLYIGFVQEPPGGEAKKKFLGFSSKTDEVHIHGREVYWLCRPRFSESGFSGGLLEKTLGIPATFRNSTTVRKMAAKYTSA